MYKYVKRAMGIVIALTAIVLLSWLMLIVAILIKIDSKGPILFKQDRIGLHGKTYKMLKFRSMYVGSEKGGVYSDSKDSRVTHIGRILRATSIDELPQLFNLLCGEMALIGPRPPLTYHPWPLSEYTEFQRRMFEVRPGLTGWAQIHGRKDVEWNKRIELNVWYVDHMSFMLDFKIFFLTIFKVLTNADNENRCATATEKSVENEPVLK